VDGLEFLKGHGTQNDFVLLPDLDGTLDLTPGLVRALCDRRAGIGADGVLRVVPAALDADAAGQADAARWFMDYRNADGSAVQMCGNGIRVFARYLVDSGLEQPGHLAVATRDGVKTVRLDRSGDVTVRMGPAKVTGPDGVRVRVPGGEWPAVPVDVGNPHAVAFVADLADAGPLLEAPVVDPVFPDGVNVEFVTVLGPRHLAIRVHERGVGETRSCGTGAVAVAAAGAAQNADDGGPGAYEVDVPGGALRVTLGPDGESELTGPAVLVGSGRLHPDWLAAVARKV
jgi:diaminopimelate epimerase